MTKSDSSDKEDPLLAFSWGKDLFLLSVQAHQVETRRAIQLKFVQLGERKIKESIVSIQWINRQVIQKKYQVLHQPFFFRYLSCLLQMKK